MAEPTPQPSRRTDARREDNAKTMRAGWQLMGVGWEFGSQVVAGLLLGWGIDWLFNTRPWGLVIGPICGLAVGMWTFIRRAMAIDRSLGTPKPPPGGWREPPKDEEPPADEDADTDDRPREGRP
ncbi:MAG: AtpZ/AtpI family protein [Phycisphaerae bacterium]|nr:AtpZ/AtpI family protein [Phycisphaerae bacterium]